MNKTGLIAKISIKYVLPACIWKYFWQISRYFAFFGQFRGIARKYLNFAGPRPREISETLYKAEYVVVKAILFGFKNLPGLHVQQIGIPNCRTSITFLIIICHSASARHPTNFFCFYNIKSKSASYFWLFSHENSARWRKTKLGGT